MTVPLLLLSHSAFFMPWQFKFLYLSLKHEYCLESLQPNPLVEKLKRNHRENHPWLQSRWLYPAAAFFAGLGVSTNVPAQQLYTYLINLNSRTATDISSAGEGSYARGVNDAGQVVGESWTGTGRHAFITGPNGVGIRDLGTLGGYRSYANAVNGVGQVVGFSWTVDNNPHAFITGPDGAGMTDLNSLVDLPAEMILYTATGINNNGQLVAMGTLIPEPETSALMLGGLVLVGFMASQRSSKVEK